MPDIEAQRAFLAHILPPPAPGQSYFYAWKVPDNPNDWHQKPVGTLEEIVAASNQLAAAGLDTYFATGVFNGQGVRTQANSLGAKALWADIDVGAGKPYAAIADALPGLIALCKDHRLPAPTLVQSGGGLHCYWVLDRVVDAAEWLGLAERLRAAARRSGLSMDPKPVCNIASVLRLPGTQNYKRAAQEGHGRPVTVGPLQPPIGVDYILQHLPAPPPDERGPGRAAGSVSPELQKYLAWTDAEEAVYADDVADRCQWVRTAGRDKRGNVSEPEWYALLGLVQFLDDADAVAEEWSDGHPTFSRQETAKKLAQARERQEGPTTCRYFESLEPKGCQGCPVRGQITTPLQLGRGKWLDAFLVQPSDSAVSVVSAPGGNGSFGAPATVLKPSITIRGGDLAIEASAGERALLQAGWGIYARGGNLVRVVETRVENTLGGFIQGADIVSLTLPYMLDVLARSAIWQRWSEKKGEMYTVDPPEQVARVILARHGEWLFPNLSGVTVTPTLRPDGSLLDKPGYDPATQTVLVAPPPMPLIPDRPTRDDALAALAILDHVLCEFPFVDAASRSVGLSALITPVVRGMFNVVPLHVVNAPASGTGKSYLGSLACVLVTGRPASAMSLGDRGDELEKRLDSAVLRGQPLMFMDNINGELGSDRLGQVVEQGLLEVRPLGSSKIETMESRSTVFANGNNIVLVGDMVRRVIIATIDAKIERPELKTFNFRPREDIARDRGKYVGAALTIIRAYLVAGSPNKATPPLASFERWSDVVRSTLIWLGCDDPVKTLSQARASEPRIKEMNDVFRAIADGIGRGTPKTAAEILRIVEANRHINPDHYDILLEVAEKSGRIDAHKFGNWLRKHKGRMYEGRCLSGDATKPNRPTMWWVD